VPLRFHCFLVSTMYSDVSSNDSDCPFASELGSHVGDVDRSERADSCAVG